MKWVRDLDFSFLNSTMGSTKAEPLSREIQENTKTTEFFFSLFSKEAQGTRRKRKLFAFASAVALHLILFIFVVVNFHWFSKSLNLGNQKSPAIHSYLYQGKLPKDAFIPKPFGSTAPKTMRDAEAKISSKKIQSANQTISKKQSQVASKTQNSDTKGNTTDALLTLLHNKIQAAQVYPSSALAMQRSGQATVSFTLSPDGDINNLKLTRSSSTKSLDDAALAAVEHAAPFQGIGQYLTTPKSFEIAVSFELPEES